MKLLILGGTAFLGRCLVEASRQRGHDVTLFNRGRSNPHLFPDVETLQGDRDGGLAVLHGRRWDAVIDTSGYIPRLVRDAAALLAEAADHYSFVSTLSVYDRSHAQRQDEKAPLKTLSGPMAEDLTEATYGGLKARCEHAAETAMPGRVCILRPGLIVGKYDYVGRFAYWLQRVARGGEVLAPGSPQRCIQLLDAHDLAVWMMHMAESRQTGTYNVTGPAQTLTMQQLLDTIRAVTGSGATFTWVAEHLLLDHEVEPFNEMPLWLPEASNGIFRTDIGRALAAGLTFRPLAQTVQDTWTWLTSTPPGTPSRNEVLGRRVGMTPEREAMLLQAWHAQNRR